MYRACVLALAGFVAAPAFAQTDDETGTDAPAETPDGVASPQPAAPEPEASDDEAPAEDSADPEPRVSSGASDSGSTGSTSTGESAEGLGRAVTEPSVEEDLAEATEEATQPAGADDESAEMARLRRENARREGETEEAYRERLRRLLTGEEVPEELDPAARLAQANPTAGLPWSMPTVWAHTITARTLAPGAQQTYNPYYNQTISVRPRWNFNPEWSVGARMDLDIELTDSGLGSAYANPTNSNRQLYWQDLRLDATYSKGGLPGGLILAPSLGLRLPTSEFSRGQNRVLGINPSILLLRPTPLLQGFIPGIQLSYLYWAGTSNVAQPRRNDGASVDPSTPIVSNSPGAIASARCTTAGPNGPVADGDCGDGTGVTQHQLAATVFANLVPISKLQLSVFYSSLWLKGAQLATACIGGDGSGDDGVVTAGGEPACIPDNSVTKWRIFGVFGFSIGYDVLPYLTASISYSTLAIHPDSDGNGIENPIWNENTQLALNFQFRPSALARLLRDARAAAAAEEGDSGEEEASRPVRPTAF